MRLAALLVALVTIVVGIVGLVSPDTLTMGRRMYFGTPVAFHAAGVVRVAMGLMVILSATASRAPKTLRALGGVMCLQALSATLLGPDHARAVLEWEALLRPAVLRLGAAVALGSGAFIAFAISRPPRRSPHDRQISI